MPAIALSKTEAACPVDYRRLQRLQICVWRLLLSLFLQGPAWERCCACSDSKLCFHVSGLCSLLHALFAFV